VHIEVMYAVDVGPTTAVFGVAVGALPGLAGGEDRVEVGPDDEGCPLCAAAAGAACAAHRASPVHSAAR
jgi:hypothetical protein